MSLVFKNPCLPNISMKFSGKLTYDDIVTKKQSFTLSSDSIFFKIYSEG